MLTLFRLGAACKRAAVGKLLPDDLYVHSDALEHLEPLLRIYEGCGRAYLGAVEGANLVKIHRRSGKLSYLVYPDFDRDPHPALLRCVQLCLRTRRLDCYDYAGSANPPILHRKETFLPPDHPLQAKFARLTAQEDKQGLLADASCIGTRGLATPARRARVCSAGASAGEAMAAATRGGRCGRMPRGSAACPPKHVAQS